MNSNESTLNLCLDVFEYLSMIFELSHHSSPKDDIVFNAQFICNETTMLNLKRTKVNTIYKLYLNDKEITSLKCAESIVKSLISLV